MNSSSIGFKVSLSLTHVPNFGFPHVCSFRTLKNTACLPSSPLLRALSQALLSLGALLGSSLGLGGSGLSQAWGSLLLEGLRALLGSKLYTLRSGSASCAQAQPGPPLVTLPFNTKSAKKISLILEQYTWNFQCTVHVIFPIYYLKIWCSGFP
jgi:hypothetical protein